MSTLQLSFPTTLNIENPQLRYFFASVANHLSPTSRGLYLLLLKETVKTVTNSTLAFPPGDLEQQLRRRRTSVCLLD